VVLEPYEARRTKETQYEEKGQVILKVRECLHRSVEQTARNQPKPIEELAKEGQYGQRECTGAAIVIRQWQIEGRRTEPSQYHHHTEDDGKDDRRYE